ncbi:class I SAM-dependent methyltransferase [Streptomyces sp. NPDC006339]|uniref:class I SAM-dependent methyltransferase n=1 Tax=Streptomyces sp. NPDC006339 TaxID=3156755 RepID=UPI0033B34201
MEETNVFYRHPALYDAVQSDTGSAETCRSLIERYCPDASTLVDFGCGTGRDVEVLTKYYECVGVDLQPGLVEYARRVRPRLDFRVGDMRTSRLGARMDIVTCLGNSLAYVHDNHDIERVFATFAAHARAGGVLVLCSPVWPLMPAEPTRSTVDTPQGPATVIIRHEWDLRTQINTMRREWVLASGERARDEILRRVLFPRELEHYATAAGFDVLNIMNEPGAGLTGPTAYTVARYAP